MTLVSDDIVEQGARAIYKNSGWGNWDAEPASIKDDWRRRARICLQASLPLILEEAAKVAERAIKEIRDLPPPTPDSVEVSNYAKKCAIALAVDIATAIRQLSKGDGNG